MPDTETVADLEIPVEIRSHERAQLEKWVPEAVYRVQKAGLEEQADQLVEIGDSIENAPDERACESYVGILNMTFDKWTTLVRSLERVEDEYGRNRVQWLRRKLFLRIQDYMDDLDVDMEDDEL